MKTNLFILLIYTIFNIVASEDGQLQKQPVSLRKFPKKHKTLFDKPLYLTNRRYLKKLGLERKTTKKHRLDNTEYTAFPPPPGENPEKPLIRDPLGIPDSPYFPSDNNVEHKTRVKKVLVDYPHARKKRSPADKKALKDVNNDKSSLLHNKTKNYKELKKRDAAENGAKTKATKSTKKFAHKEHNKKRKHPLSEPVNAKKPKSSLNKSKSLVSGTIKAKSSRKDKKRARGKKRDINNKGNKTRKGNKKHPLWFGKGKETLKSAKRTKILNDRVSKKAKRSRPQINKKPRVNVSRRLIAGRDALIEDYPYVVSVQKDGEHWCGGALLNQRLAITTANCVWKASRVSRMRVRAGSRFTDRGGQVARIQELLKHPGWSIRKEPNYDLALLLLDRNIKFSHSVHAVDLPNRVMMPAFEDAWITSWGADRRDGIYENKALSLQVYHARLVDREKCNNVTQRFGVTVTNNFICLAQTGRRAPCTRDTGAPAVSDGVLWGLASWGIRKLCGTERFPAVFTYVASHSNMDFVANATRHLMADERHYPFVDRYVVHAPAAAPSTTALYGF